MKIILIVIAFSSIVSCTSQQQKIKNLEAFAKVYGYVKYFHPSDETTKVDWLNFSAYGAEKVENCRTKQQLASTLTYLFSPMAPSVRFVVSNTKPTYDLQKIIPQQRSASRLTYWQHLGVSTGAKKFAFKNAYQSFRVNRDTLKGIGYQPKIEDVFTTEIGDGIYCQIPMVLYCDEKSTYPKADSTQFKNLEEKVFNSASKSLAVKQGNVINVYNVIQHFYPYFDVVNVNWNREFEKALQRCYTDLSPKDHLITLEKFTAPLKDGHIHFQMDGRTDYYPGISWEWIENKLVLTQVSLGEKRFHTGDVVTKINGINSEKYFEEIKSQISAGTDSYLNFMANIRSLSGDENSVLKITIDDKEIDLRRYDYYYYYYRENKGTSKQIGEGIYYLNMGQLETEDLKKLLPELVKAKAMICDARGYPKGGEPYFISHLLKSDDTTRAWMQVPYFVHPDHKDVIGYEKFNWIQMMKARKPYLGDKKIIYLIDGSAISYAESCLGYIEGYKLATIVGQPSAGTNGNVNAFDLLGGFSFSFTGMKVLKHNNTQHHGIGILPNIYVSKTIQGIKEGRDEFLEKAISIAKQ